MRGQIWYVAFLIGLMCIIRFSLSAVGYADPEYQKKVFSPRRWAAAAFV